MIRGLFRYKRVFFVCALLSVVSFWVLWTYDFSTVTSRSFSTFEGSKCINFSILKLSSLPLEWTVNDHNHNPRFQPLCQSYFPCDWTPQTFFRPTRIQASLHCGPASTTISFSKVQSTVSPTLTAINDSLCLKRIIDNHCLNSIQRIPNVAHYVQFGAYDMTVDAFFSVVSVARFVQPCLVLFHGDAIPTGRYWQALLHLVPNMVHVPMKRPREIFGHPIRVVEHSADVARMKLLIEYGGMYLDKDYLMLRSVDDLLNLSTVMGTEAPNVFCNGFIVAEAGAKFMNRWLSNYHDFKDSQWNTHSGYRSFQLSKDFPDLIRVVNTFFHPGFGGIRKYFSRKSTPRGYNWSQNYGFHLYTRVVKDRVYGSLTLDRQDSVVGDMVRYILFGKDAAACLNKTHTNG